MCCAILLIPLCFVQCLKIPCKRRSHKQSLHKHVTLKDTYSYTVSSKIYKNKLDIAERKEMKERANVIKLETISFSTVFCFGQYSNCQDHRFSISQKFALYFHQKLVYNIYFKFSRNAYFTLTNMEWTWSMPINRILFAGLIWFKNVIVLTLRTQSLKGNLKKYCK